MKCLVYLSLLLILQVFYIAPIYKKRNMTNLNIQNQPPNGAGSKKTGGNTEQTSYKTRTANLSPEQLKKIKGFQLMVAGAIFLIVPSLELYRRLYAGGERRIQQGEFNPSDGTIKEWDEEEKVRNFQDSWLTKLFGEK